MKPKRFTKSVVEAARKETTQMPWTRGARRTAFLAKRQAEADLRKSA